MASDVLDAHQRITHLLGEVFAGLAPQVREDLPFLELTVSQLRTLTLVHMRGPLRMSDVASALAIGMPTATSLVGRLEEKGLLQRTHDTKDRRVVFCSTTEEGKNQAERFLTLRMDSLRLVVSHLTQAEAEVVVDGLANLMKAINRVRLERGETPLCP